VSPKAEPLGKGSSFLQTSFFMPSDISKTVNARQMPSVLSQSWLDTEAGLWHVKIQLQQSLKQGEQGSLA